uniref:Uncharacterized protein n=1 Tax=Rhizophora mucronata TaxID=61149 RepID=A0A2P2KMI1_RHIMU
MILQVLKNGDEVKLQRNALSVLEHPTGNEVDDDKEIDSSSGSDICEKDQDISSGSEYHKNRKPRVRPARPYVPSASTAKSANRSSYRDVQSIIHTLQPVRYLAEVSACLMYMPNTWYSNDLSLSHLIHLKKGLNIWIASGEELMLNLIPFL